MSSRKIRLRYITSFTQLWSVPLKNECRSFWMMLFCLTTKSGNAPKSTIDLKNDCHELLNNRQRLVFSSNLRRLSTSARQIRGRMPGQWELITFRELMFLRLPKWWNVGQVGQDEREQRTTNTRSCWAAGRTEWWRIAAWSTVSVSVRAGETPTILQNVIAKRRVLWEDMKSNDNDDHFTEFDCWSEQFHQLRDG
jgi:hypothetical protein